MAVFFEGFPRVLDRSALKPGRWFLASVQRAPLLCFSTDAEIEEKPIVLTFRIGKPEQIEFAPYFLDEITGLITTVEDDLVFGPGDGGGSCSWRRLPSEPSRAEHCCACATAILASGS